MHEDLQRRLQAALDALPEGAARAFLESLQQKLRDSFTPEVLQLHVNTRIQLRGSNGELKDERILRNVICVAGKNLILSAGGTAKYPKDFGYVLIGTNNTAETNANTALGAESARALGTVSNPSANVLRIAHTFPAGVGTGSIVEAGLDYQNTPSGAILNRQTFGVITKGAGDSLAMQFDIS